MGGRRSPAVACWASDRWVASSNPLIIPGICLAQFSLSNVHKRGLKHHLFISFTLNIMGIMVSSQKFSISLI